MADNPSNATLNEVPACGVDDHLTDARKMARDVLSGESHLGEVDDWRQAIVTARDGVMLVWLIWVAMSGLGVAVQSGPILLAAGVGISLYLGVASGIATRLRLRYYEGELERERREIEEDPEHERAEVIALYAAKGFREPILGQIADTLCADDDRLLKVMMEEELGLFIQHINHPLLVGLWNSGGAAFGTLLLGGLACALTPAEAAVWMPAGTAIILGGLAAASASTTQRTVLHVAASWIAVAAVAGGCTFFTAALLAERM